MNDPLFPHLIDLLSKAPKDSFILGGGFGLQVKRAHQMRAGVETLAGSVGQELPEARATSDIDLFLKIEIFTEREVGVALRSAINELGYRERTPKWQFEKDFGGLGDGQSLVLDLLARKPSKESGVKARSSRVGSGSGTDLHGRETVEAFAIEDSPILRDVVDDAKFVGQVQVAHPYAMLNMKIRAAHDWFRYRHEPWPLRERQDPPSAKHAFDGALIVAMLTRDELTVSEEFARKWTGVSIADEVKKEAEILYGTETSHAWIEARRQGMFNDHPLIWNTMRQAIGLP